MRFSFGVAVPHCLHISGEEVLGSCCARQFARGSKLTALFLVLFFCFWKFSYKKSENLRGLLIVC